MRSRRLPYLLHKLKVGFTLRCPACEQGRTFEGWFKMQEKCPYCQSRFERSPGDTIGGVYINVALAELSALAGFFIVDAVLHPPILHQLYFWIPYVLVFCALFYRHARGLWLAVLHLTGAIYPDPDYEREYISPRHVRRGKTPQRHE